MASGLNWDAEKMLQLYLHDYLVKKNMHGTAEIFRREANVFNSPPAIDTPKGFLHEWWSIFYDVYAARGASSHQGRAETSFMFQAGDVGNQLQDINPAFPDFGMTQMMQEQYPVGSNFEASSLMAANGYEEGQLMHQLGEHDPSQQFIDVRQLCFFPSAATSSSHLQQQFYNQAEENIVGDDRNQFIMGSNNMTVGPNLCGASGLPEMNTGVNLIPPQNAWTLDASLFGEGPSGSPSKQVFPFPTSSNPMGHENPVLPMSDQSGKDKQIMPPVNQTIEQPQLSQQVEQDQALQENERKKQKLSDSRGKDKIVESTNSEDQKLADDTVESFLSDKEDDDHNVNSPFKNLERRPTASNKDEPEDFSFDEVGCFHLSNTKILCCDFSSDGKILASGGHEKKVLLGNTETFALYSTIDSHSHIITDIRFRPNSTIVASSSFDKSVKIWDAARPAKSPLTLVGHDDQVMSVDFHPRNTDILCSCDSNDVIRLWNVNQCVCTRVNKGATKRVRFQPWTGSLLATAVGNYVNIIDFDTGSSVLLLKGHQREVISICWDSSGKYIASVSEDSVRVWSATGSGECIHELHANGNRFQACTFHPGYSPLLIVGAYQNLTLWNLAEGSKTWTIQAHNGLISSVADSLETEMVASASHDKCVKLWR